MYGRPTSISGILAPLTVALAAFIAYQRGKTLTLPGKSLQRNVSHQQKPYASHQSLDERTSGLQDLVSLLLTVLETYIFSCVSVASLAGLSKSDSLAKMCIKRGSGGPRWKMRS